MDKSELIRAERTERRKLAKEQKQERQKLRNEQAKRRKSNRTTKAGGKREGAGRPQEIPQAGIFPERKPCSFYVSAEEKNAVKQFLTVCREIRFRGDSSLLAQIDGESLFQLFTGGMITNPKDRETLRQIMPNVAELEWTPELSLATLEKKLIQPPAGKQGRPRRVLTAEERQEIQERHKAGETIGELAKALHMGTRTIARVLKGEDENGEVQQGQGGQRGTPMA